MLLAGFDYVVGFLAPEFSVAVRDLILALPAANAYSTLKDQLIKRTAASEQRRLQQLRNAEELSDRKPTQLLRRIQQLLSDAAGPNSDNSCLRELFLQRLPSHVHMVLASSGGDAFGRLGPVGGQGHGGCPALGLCGQCCPPHIRG